MFWSETTKFEILPQLINHKLSNQSLKKIRPPSCFALCIPLLIFKMQSKMDHEAALACPIGQFEELFSIVILNVCPLPYLSLIHI